jgi:hypothetical protein
MSDPSLSWRVPTSGDPRLLRLGLAQVALAGIVAALALLVAAPREWLGPALLGLIPLAIFMAYRRWAHYQRSLQGSDNVRIDAAGIHWLDAAGVEQTFRRDAIAGFYIGRDTDTLRPVPALTLQLNGGVESQPIELHPPATTEAVRRVLAGEWNLIEREPATTAAEPRDYDLAAFIYSECHEELQEWHWEGTRDELSRFFALFAAAAEELPLPLPGAKPAQRIILLNRREPSHLRLAHSRAPHFEFGIIAAPADLLQGIAVSAGALLENCETPSDATFDVPLAQHDTWTFHLHVRAG